MTTCPPPDRPRGVLPGSLQRRQLQGLCQEPVCVLPVQRAGLLPVRLLRRPIADQHGQAECRAAATTLPVCVWGHLRVAQLHTWNLRCNSELPSAGPPLGGGGQVSVRVCVFMHVCYVLCFCSVILNTSPFF